MKKFCGKVVYVQMADLDFLNESFIASPTSIFEKACGKEDQSFLMFDSESEVEFFKNAYWIIDYDWAMRLTIEELKTEVKKLRDEIANFTTVKNQSEEEKQQWSFKIYMLKALNEIFNVKKGIINIGLAAMIMESKELCQIQGSNKTRI